MEPGIGGGHYQCGFCKKIERLQFELNVAKEREEIDNTETRLANRRIKSLECGLRRAVDELDSWMRAAERGTATEPNSADRDMMRYIQALLVGESLSCCSYHHEGGDKEADCWEPEDMVDLLRNELIVWGNGYVRCRVCRHSTHGGERIPHNADCIMNGYTKQSHGGPAVLFESKGESE